MAEAREFTTTTEREVRKRTAGGFNDLSQENGEGGDTVQDRLAE